MAASREDEEAKKMEAGGDTVGQKLDAGALFVLQSKGKLPRSAFLFFSLHQSTSSLFSASPAWQACAPCQPSSSATIFVFLERRQGSRCLGEATDYLFSHTQPGRGAT